MFRNSSKLIIYAWSLFQKRPDFGISSAYCRVSPCLPGKVPWKAKGSNGEKEKVSICGTDPARTKWEKKWLLLPTRFHSGIAVPERRIRLETKRNPPCLLLLQRMTILGNQIRKAPPFLKEKRERFIRSRLWCHPATARWDQVESIFVNSKKVGRF